MGAVEERCLVARALNVVHCEGACDWSKLRLDSGLSILVPQHPAKNMFIVCYWWFFHWMNITGDHTNSLTVESFYSSVVMLFRSFGFEKRKNLFRYQHSVYQFHKELMLSHPTVNLSYRSCRAAIMTPRTMPHASASKVPALELHRPTTYSKMLCLVHKQIQKRLFVKAVLCAQPI